MGGWGGERVAEFSVSGSAGSSPTVFFLPPSPPSPQSPDYVNAFLPVLPTRAVWLAARPDAAVAGPARKTVAVLVERAVFGERTAALFAPVAKGGGASHALRPKRKRGATSDLAAAQRALVAAGAATAHAAALESAADSSLRPPGTSSQSQGGDPPTPAPLAGTPEGDRAVATLRDLLAALDDEAAARNAAADVLAAGAAEQEDAVAAVGVRRAAAAAALSRLTGGAEGEGPEGGPVPDDGGGDGAALYSPGGSPVDV